MADSENLYNPRNASVVSVFEPVVVEWACNSKWGKQEQHILVREKHLGT
jgi:hypothetical protein